MLQVVPVRHVPVADFTNELACSDDSVRLFDESVVINSNIAASSWTLENRNIGYIQSASGPSPLVLLKDEGTYTITLVSESNYGCVDTLSASWLLLS